MSKLGWRPCELAQQRLPDMILYHQTIVAPIIVMPTRSKHGLLGRERLIFLRHWTR